MLKTPDKDLRDEWIDDDDDLFAVNGGVFAENHCYVIGTDAIDPNKQVAIKQPERDYWIVEANTIAKAMGRLSAREQHLLDFFVSFITPDMPDDMIFEVRLRDLCQWLGLSRGGRTYRQLQQAMEALATDSALEIERDTAKGEKRRTLVPPLALVDTANNTLEDDTILFAINPFLKEYFFALKANYFQWLASESITLKTKGAMTLCRLWKVHERNPRKPTVIPYSVTEWRRILLGAKSKASANDIYRRHLLDGKKELEANFPVTVTIDKEKDGRQIKAFIVTVTPKVLLNNPLAKFVKNGGVLGHE